MLVGNRNKRSLVLDLKKPEAIEIARKLIATTDVLTENFRPGVLDKLGLGYEASRAIKPDIIYATASGYGPDGPYVNRPGQDLLVQALSGLATITGTRKQGPRAIGVSAVDHHGGALFAAGILAALVGRAKSGKGCRVDVNLLSAALDLQQESLTCYMQKVADERDDIRKTVQAIKQFTGKAPRGWLGPGLTETWETPDLLVEEGFDYVCDWVLDDQPVVLNTRSKPIVNIPYTQECNDVAMVQHLETIIADLGKMGLGILLVEQNLYSALSVADRLYVLETGKVVHEASAESIRHDQSPLMRYLGVH